MEFEESEEKKAFRMGKRFEVSESGSVPSPFPIAAHCSERKARLWCLFVLGLLAAHCSEREARVMVVVGEFKFPSFLFPFQLGSKKSEKVPAKSARLLG